MTTPAPQLLTIRIAHRAMRADLDRVVRAARASEERGIQARDLADYVRRLLDVIEHHHAGEDEYLWPALRDRGASSEDVARMTVEHQALLAPLEEMRHRVLSLEQGDGSPGALTALADSAERTLVELDAHTRDEERALVSELAVALDDQVWKGFEKHMRTTAPRWTLWFMPAWLDDAAEVDERSGVPARPVARLMRGRLARMRAAAFGR